MVKGTFSMIFIRRFWTVWRRRWEAVHDSISSCVFLRMHNSCVEAIRNLFISRLMGNVTQYVLEGAQFGFVQMANKREKNSNNLRTMRAQDMCDTVLYLLKLMCCYVCMLCEFWRIWRIFICLDKSFTGLRYSRIESEPTNQH